MNLKKKLIIGIGIGLATLAAIFFVVKQTFFPQNDVPQVNGSQGVVYNSDGTVAEGQNAYSTYNIYKQDPVTVDGVVNLKTDTAYFYNSEQGDIDSVLVKNGQTVKKGAVLYTYASTKKDDKYALEDLRRDQTRLYNQRESLIEKLGKLTNAYYNYRGDQIAYYWDNSGKQTYYVVESIGKSNTVSSSSSSSEGVANTSEGATASEGEDAESIKAQIRQVNQQIEDLEVKIIRQQEQQNSKVVAKSDGVVMINEEGRDSNSVPFVRIVSKEQSVVGSVTEYDFYALAEDRVVDIYIPAENRTITGKIIDYDKIPAYNRGAESSSGNASSSVESTSGGTNAAKFKFIVQPNEEVQAGFSAKVNITLPGYVIPNDSIIEENGKHYVFLYKDGKAHKTEVELMQQGTQKVVLKGLNDGDKLITKPNDIKDGQDITIIEQVENLENTDGIVDGSQG